MNKQTQPAAVGGSGYWLGYAAPGPCLMTTKGAEMGQKTILTDDQMRRVMAIQPVYGDDADYAHYLRMGRAVEAATNAQAMAAALDCIVRRLQIDVDDGSRPDQWTMEDLIRTAKVALPAGWVIGAA